MTRSLDELDLETRTSVLRADRVTVLDGSRVLLAPTSVELHTGEVAVVVGEPGPAHVAFCLALAGRLPYDAGVVSIDGHADEHWLQRAVALVDVPGVSEPDDAVPLRTIVGEEMAMAGLRAGRSAVTTWLHGQGIAELADVRVEDVPGAVRTRVLAGLAACREGVEFLVLTLPERHGGLPEGWLTTAWVLARLGFGVLVTASPTAAGHVDESLLQWLGGEQA
jgi:ABC-type cobalamin/Fe3+-siderophores transport system ATPase subunit